VTAMLDSILLARAAWSADDARAIAASLNVARKPTARGDALSLSRWESLIPLIRQHGGDALALRQAARGEPSLSAMVEFATCLPSWLYDEEDLGALLVAFNSGRGAQWRPQLSAAPVTEERVSSLDDGSAQRVLAFADRLGYGLSEGRAYAAQRFARYLLHDIRLTVDCVAHLLERWNDHNHPPLRAQQLREIIADAHTSVPGAAEAA
jgi:hypothetical protein